MSDILPLRLLFFLAGAGSVVALHPRIRGSLSRVVLTALSGSGPGLSFQLSLNIPCLPHPLSLLPTAACRVFRVSSSPAPLLHSCTRTFALTIVPRDICLFIRRLIDDDKLDDAVWNAPIAHVELWENERWVPDVPEGKRRKSTLAFVREGEEDANDDDTASITSAATTTATVTGLGDGGKAGTWSKANLKQNERIGWTRGRDGWSGIGGEVSNLTFSLSPGWDFVETEGWRPDLNAAWAIEGATPSTSVCVGADEDGWTYTTDTWTHPRPDARPSDGWVTRRRRWVRRVYFKGAEQ